VGDVVGVNTTATSLVTVGVVEVSSPPHPDMRSIASRIKRLPKYRKGARLNEGSLFLGA
jgi:hypothetical protein